MQVFYSIYGSVLGSDFPYPELEPRRIPQQGRPDIGITLGPPVASVGAPGAEPSVDWNGGSPVLVVPGVARYHIAPTGEIVVAPQASADFETVAYCAFVPALILMLQLRGLFMLHASAVAFRGRAIAFVGRSGDGKSTLAAHCLRDRQGEVALVADDVLAISIGPDNLPRAHVGTPTLSLWRDTLGAIGQGAEGLQPAWARADKFRFPPAGDQLEKALPLTAIYELVADEEAGAGRIAAVKGADAVAAIAAHSPCFGVLYGAEARRSHFATAARLAGLGLMHRLSRRRNIDSVAQTSAMVLAASVPALERC